MPGCAVEIEDNEIVVSGRTIFQNYFNDEDHTKQKLRNGKFYTGDTGFIDDDGFLFVTGRKDEMIISGGENINPAEIKNLLESHPSITEAFVFGVPDKKWGEAVTAAVVPDNKNIDSDELKDWLKVKAASFKIPKKIFLLTGLPKTDLGKIDKRKVLEQIYKKEFLNRK